MNKKKIIGKIIEIVLLLFFCPPIIIALGISLNFNIDFVQLVLEIYKYYNTILFILLLMLIFFQILYERILELLEYFKK